MKIHKGDTVKVTVGKDKGKTGKVEKVFPKLNKVLVPGVNIYKKHLKKQGENKPGGIIDLVKPLLINKVALICPKCHLQTRIGYKISREAGKARRCQKCHELI